MDEGSLRKAIDGLYAYDRGAVDSGIRDERLRGEVQEHVASLPPDERRRVLSRSLRDLHLTDEAIEQGYGWEDARSLADWFDDQFGVG